MRGGLTAVAVLAAMTAVACDHAKGGGGDLVIEGRKPARPYSGPLDVRVTSGDQSSQRGLRLATGAAGRALECDGGIYDGGGPDAWSERDGGDSPEEGLRRFFDMVQPEVPESGYRVERRDGDRVLYSYDVGGRTKVAVVVAKDQRNRPGWGPETYATCDPAELPASFTGSKGWEIWTDRHGERVPVGTLSSSPGAEHCGWQSGHLLSLGRHTYARDPQGVLGHGLLTAAYRGDVHMPADAHDTGYRYHDWALWLTDDRKTAYVRTSHGVEAWPLVRPGEACK